MDNLFKDIKTNKEAWESNFILSQRSTKIQDEIYRKVFGQDIKIKRFAKGRY